MRKILSALSMLTALTITAQNPIIRDQFAADPTARVFNNKVYVYPSQYGCKKGNRAQHIYGKIKKICSKQSKQISYTNVILKRIYKGEFIRPILNNKNHS